MKRTVLLALLIPFLGLPACALLPTGPTTYHITEYAPDGSVGREWETSKVDLAPGRVSWTLPDGSRKSVTGSYKVVRRS